MARHAIENDVHAVGISTQFGGHRTLVPQLVRELRAGDLVVTVDGIVPQKGLLHARSGGRELRLRSRHEHPERSATRARADRAKGEHEGTRRRT